MVPTVVGVSETVRMVLSVSGNREQLLVGETKCSASGNLKYLE
jgi:hypothetical protein